jgi:hypothetical protein
MTRLIQQVFSQQAPQILHDLGLDDRVEPMAAEVAIDAIELEAPGISANPFPLFEHGDTGKPLLDKLVGRACSSRACTENHYVLWGRLTLRR